MPRSLRDREVLEDFADDQARDLHELPNVARLERPGPWGTYAENTHGSAPHAPTLDNGPLYTGEYREEINGDITTLIANVPTTLATLRRPWPWIGFAVDGRGLAGAQVLLLQLRVILRSGPAVLVASASGTQTIPITVTGPVGWVAVSGVACGARAEVFATLQGGQPVKVRGTIWGTNISGFGP
jgi:hypothetical protein